MIAQQIQQIIDELKGQKNSLERNKMVSHLEDAKAWAIRQSFQATRAQMAQADEHPNQVCICPAGAVDTTCEVHGND